MEPELTDFIVTSETIRKVEEYDRPKDGYELIIGIPAAWTPVCAEEMEALNFGFVVRTELDTVSHIVMLDTPSSIQAWIRENHWYNLQVLVSHEAAYVHDLLTGDLERPVSRTVIVSHYEPRQPKGTVEKAFSKGLFGETAMTFSDTHELLRYTTHMDIPRNFEEMERVVTHHANNRM